MKESEKMENEVNGSFFIDAVKQIKKSFTGDVTSIDAIRESLSQDREEQIDFIDLLKKHHDFLGESIRVLLDKNAEVYEKQAHLERFIKLLDMHGLAEQETLYRTLQDNEEKEARLEGFSGQNEHDIAYQLADELIDMNFSDEWSEEIDAKAKVLATLVKAHIKEEESNMFVIARSDLAEEELNTLSDSYIDKCLTQLTTFAMSMADDFNLTHH